jgi:hypothetical protein
MRYGRKQFGEGGAGSEESSLGSHGRRGRGVRVRVLGFQLGEREWCP